MAADWAMARRLLERGRGLIEHRLGDADAPTLPMWGSPHLNPRSPPAVSGTATPPTHTLREAGETAQRLGADGDNDRLRLGRRTAPRPTRYHPMVHDTIGALARVKRRSDPLTRLAAWAGVRNP